MSKKALVVIASFALIIAIAITRTGSDSSVPATTLEEHGPLAPQPSTSVAHDSKMSTEIKPAHKAASHLILPAPYDGSTGYPDAGELIVHGDTVIVSTGAQDYWAPRLGDDAREVEREIVANSQSGPMPLPPVDQDPQGLFELLTELVDEAPEEPVLTLSNLVADEDDPTTDGLAITPIPPGSAPRPGPYFEPDDEND